MQSKRYTQNKTRLRKGEYQRPNNTFEYRWKDKFGKNHVVYAKTLPELRKKEEDITRDILDGIDYSKLDLTINDYFEIWKRIKVGIRETTFVSYVRTYERYVEPTFGKLKLKNVSFSDVALFYTKLSVEKGLNFNSINNINAPLSGTLDIAVKDNVIRFNPCKGALHELHRTVKTETEEVRALTLKEQQIFEDFLAKPGRFHVYRPIFTVMLWTGMRVGEVVGLRWEDIDFDKGIIHVAHTLTKCYSVSCDQISFTMNPPKTRKSNRFIPMTPRVKDAILLEKAYQAHSGIEYTTDINGFSDFVFLDDKGKVFRNTKLNDVLRRISKKINEEIKNNKSLYGLTSFPHIHAHTLRHTFATRMREAGADIKATADIMGHTEVNLTLNTYTDASQEFKRREISLLDRQVKSRVV